MEGSLGNARRLTLPEKDSSKGEEKGLSTAIVLRQKRMGAWVFQFCPYLLQFSTMERREDYITAFNTSTCH